MTKQITERHRCIAGAAILDGKPLCEVCFAPIDNALKGPVFAITIRPWRAAGGSSVHDELVYMNGKDDYGALMNLYTLQEYDWNVWRVVGFHCV